MSCDKGNLDVFTLGAHVHNYRVIHDDGYVFTPFAVADWLGDDRNCEKANIPRHLHQLGGEFPCVPFGTTSLDQTHHGYGVDHPWNLLESGDNFIVFDIEYPESHAVRRLQRTITIERGTGALRISHEIETRKACRLPIGFHPIFKIPSGSNGLRVIPPTFDRGAFLPLSLRGNSPAEDDQLELVSSIRPSWLSLGSMESSLFQLWNVSGLVSLEYPQEQCVVDLEWDQALLPNCLFWIANPEFQEYGLGNGFVGMGVEPTHSFFDRNDCANDYQRLHQRGSDKFGIKMQSNEILSASYRIVCRRMLPKT